MGRLLNLSDDHIAVAGGDLATSRLIGGLLRDMGTGAVTLLDDEACVLACLQRPHFDVLICNMDAMRRDTLRQLAQTRLQPRPKRGVCLPVILLTRWPTANMVRLVDASGAAALLLWPTSPIRLMRALARGLGRPSPDDQAPAFWFAEDAWAPRARRARV